MKKLEENLAEKDKNMKYLKNDRAGKYKTELRLQLKAKQFVENFQTIMKELKAGEKRANDKLTAAVDAKEKYEATYAELSGKIKKAVMLLNSNDDSADDPVGTAGMILAGVEESIRREKEERITRLLPLR